MIANNDNNGSYATNAASLAVVYAVYSSSVAGPRSLLARLRSGRTFWAVCQKQHSDIIKMSDEFFGMTRFFGMFVLWRGAGGGRRLSVGEEVLAFVFEVLTSL